MKKLLSLVAAMSLVVTMAACGSTTDKAEQTPAETPTETPTETPAETPTASLGKIDVVSREEGSGTRGAFEELIGFNVADKEGVVADPMASDITIKDGNGVVATYVAENEASIGYVSFVTLHEKGDVLKGLTVEGVEPTAKNVLAGQYGVSRPFAMVYMEDNITEVEKAFIAFLASKDGLEILESTGTIVDLSTAQDFDVAAYKDLSGNMTLGGSTSTEKAIKAAADEFSAIFPKVTYTYDGTGSGTGIKNAQDGTYTLGFASREVKDSEKETGLTDVTLCMDGIALVVNPTNTASDITLQQVKDIYTGVTTDWSEVK